MTTTFVFKNEMILCRQTLTGWLPLQIELPQINDTQKDGENSIKTVKSSKRPISIKKDKNHFPKIGI